MAPEQTAQTSFAGTSKKPKPSMTDAQKEAALSQAAYMTVIAAALSSCDVNEALRKMQGESIFHSLHKLVIAVQNESFEGVNMEGTELELEYHSAVRAFVSNFCADASDSSPFFHAPALAKRYEEEAAALYDRVRKSNADRVALREAMENARNEPWKAPQKEQGR